MDVTKRTSFSTFLMGEELLETLRKSGLKFNPETLHVSLVRLKNTHQGCKFRLNLSWTEEESWEV